MFSGLPQGHAESYHHYMWFNFFKHIDIDPHNVHILNGNASDLVQECNKYEEQIKASGGINLFIGGCKILHYYDIKNKRLKQTSFNSSDYFYLR